MIRRRITLSREHLYKTSDILRILEKSDGLLAQQFVHDAVLADFSYTVYMGKVGGKNKKWCIFLTSLYIFNAYSAYKEKELTVSIKYNEKTNKWEISGGHKKGAIVEFIVLTDKEAAQVLLTDTTHKSVDMY